MSPRFRGCLLGGAVGDALGAPVEFLSFTQIHERYGPQGIRDFDVKYGRRGAITDDTQMTLFTAEGLLRATVRGSLKGIGGAEVGLVKNAYMRWLKTQGCPLPKDSLGVIEPDARGWLMGHHELFSQRGPGNTCLTALMQTPFHQLAAENDSKGCGSVMRVAPVAMYVAARSSSFPRRRESSQSVFELAVHTSAITHGHPTAGVSSGAMAVLLLAIFQGSDLPAAAAESLRLVQEHDSYGETAQMLLAARGFAERGVPSAEAIPKLGEGWIAEEALGIALYCALSARDFESGIRMAVNIQGDSDSTGAITGNILGALYGENAIPPRWLEELELREVIGEIAEDFVRMEEPVPEGEDWGERWWGKYPGF